MDTRLSLMLLIDYENIYGTKGKIEDAKELIKDIPSETLINYISGFIVNLYLNENTEESGTIQARLIDSILSKAGEEYIAKWQETIEKEASKGNAPILIWEYSNLKFYSLIFETYNTLPCRDLTQDEAKRFFDAYLIVNSISNGKIDVSKLEEDKKEYEENIENLTIPSFIYQRDYTSSYDFSNQLTRGVMLFRFLENHKKYKASMPEYYKILNVPNYKVFFRSVLTLFTELKIEQFPRKQVAELKEYIRAKFVEPNFINSLCVNSSIVNYQEDDSFGTLRRHMLYKYNAYNYGILNVNFLIDLLYKAQVFSINSFLKSVGVEKNFLSVKAKEFMEEIYLPKIVQSSFLKYKTVFNEDVVNSKNEELCDAYIRQDDKVCLIEFKDILLNAKIKNSHSREQLFAELDKKLVENEKGKPKGITQLVNAIKDIEEHSIVFDNESEVKHIYPTIVYTDTTFGMDGLNHMLNEKFKDAISDINQEKIKIHDLTLISLSFIELHEDYFNKEILNFFNYLDLYHEHTNQKDYRLASLEVFSRVYFKKHNVETLSLSSTYQQLLKEVTGL